MQMKCHEFNQFSGALERAINDRAAPSNHSPLLVHLKEDDNLRLTPLHPELLPLRFAVAADLFHNRSHSEPAAIYLGDDVLARELVARRQIAAAESHQITGAGGQHL